MTESEFAGLRGAVLAHSTLHHSFDHGERHWRSLAYAGLRLAPTVRGCQPHIVLLFALFHDSIRENEYEDPTHMAESSPASYRVQRRWVPDWRS